MTDPQPRPATAHDIAEHWFSKPSEGHDPLCWMRHAECAMRHMYGELTSEIERLAAASGGATGEPPADDDPWEPWEVDVRSAIGRVGGDDDDAWRDWVTDTVSEVRVFTERLLAKASRVAPLPDTAAPPMDDEAFEWLMAAVKETEASDTAAADEKRGAAWVRANVLAAGGAGVAPQPPDAALIALDLYTIAERLEEGDSIGDLPLGWSGTFARLRQAADALMASRETDQ